MVPSQSIFELTPPSIETLAQSFSAITLPEMERVRLMNRTDTKFLLPLSRLPSLLNQLSEHYRWLEIDGQRFCAYETLYFDTVDLRFYHAHRTQRLNRYKIRQRHYVASNLTFTEIKHKTNKGRTVKTRIPNAYPPGKGFDPDSAVFLTRHTGFGPDKLNPVLWVEYIRLTLVSQTTAERLTIDLNLNFRNDFGYRAYPQVVVAELKQDARQPSFFLNLMKKARVQPGSLSKYCLGLISLDPSLKQNLFKPKLNHFRKLLAYDHLVATPFCTGSPESDRIAG
ncbi:polyphosphate polymerase domain-containing protein [Larkinella sp. VNQ87]|uniref:polyphosphate polymerase domain-containing protein n=1 Tax=Larkinella sp. VNQ87 TaxID=3400921 RepID=UPI003C0C7369